MQRVGLQPARYIQAAAIRYRDMKRHDISISLLGYDMITSRIHGSVRAIYLYTQPCTLHVQAVYTAVCVYMAVCMWTRPVNTAVYMPCTRYMAVYVP